MGLLSQPIPTHPPWEAQVVADQRAGPGLSPDPALVDDERAQAFGGAVDGRGQSCRPCTHDDDVEVALVEVGGGPGSLRDLSVRWVAERAPVRKDHDRELHVGTCLREELAPLVGVGQAERVRSRAAPEGLPQLVRPSRPLLADDVDGVRHLAQLRRPLEQEGRDGVVEHLVRPTRRHGDVVIDAPQGDRVEDRLGGRRVCQGVPRDHQPALGMRMKLPRSREQSTAGHTRERLGRQHQGQLVTGIGQLRQLTERLLRIVRALDPVVVAIASDELSLDVPEGVQVAVDNEEDGAGHRSDVVHARRPPSPRAFSLPERKISRSRPLSTAPLADRLWRDCGAQRGHPLPRFGFPSARRVSPSYARSSVIGRKPSCRGGWDGRDGARLSGVVWSRAKALSALRPGVAARSPSRAGSSGTGQTGARGLAPSDDPCDSFSPLGTYSTSAFQPTGLLPCTRPRRVPFARPLPTAGGYSSRSYPALVGMPASRRRRRAAALGRFTTRTRGQWCAIASKVGLDVRVRITPRASEKGRNEAGSRFWCAPLPRTLDAGQARRAALCAPRGLRGSSRLPHRDDALPRRPLPKDGVSGRSHNAGSPVPHSGAGPAFVLAERAETGPEDGSCRAPLRGVYAGALRRNGPVQVVTAVGGNRSG